MHSHTVYYVLDIACAHLFHDVSGITLFIIICLFCVTLGRFVRYKLLLLLLLLVWLAILICLAV